MPPAALAAFNEPFVMTPAVPALAATATVAVAAAATATATSAPAHLAPVEAFELPIASLAGIAQQAGLEWINSDAEKVRLVQDQIANEPRPIRVPREPKPLLQIDAGPLVLVETRRDLSQFKLPFEAGVEAQQQ
jgi:ribonuclease E